VQLIAVVGGSGAGKGWFVERLCRLLTPNACPLQLDDFYHDLSHLPLEQRAAHNFDVPEAIDWFAAERVLRACGAGRPTRLPRYDFATYSRGAERDWEPRPVVFVDGLWLLLPPAVRELFTLGIYLDTPEELRRTRRLVRDTAERGYSRELVEHQLQTVMPMHDRHVEPQKRWANVVLTQPYRETEVAALAGALWPVLARAGALPCWEQETFRMELIDLLLCHEYCT
jgi:uridine kinase